MPRTGWLACGAIGAALAVTSLGPLPTGLLAVVGTLAALGALGALGSMATLRSRASALLVLGAALVLVRAALIAPEVADAPATDLAERTTHRALVVTTYTPAGGMQRAVLELEAEPGGASAGRIYANLPRYPALTIGDHVQLEGRLEPAPPAGESGFAEFLARAAIGYTVRARQLELVSSDLTPAVELQHLRRDAGDAMARMLPEPQAGLAAAIVIGLRDRVSREVATDFRIAGLSHVVAISGFHVALVAALASALLRPLSRRPRSLALLLLLVGYAVLAGASPSVLRATAMAGTVLVLRISGRRGQAAAALGMAVLLLLLAEPATVSEVGFQLSVAATAGLLRWASPLADWLAGHLPRSMPRWLTETLGVSLAAQLATLPLVVLHFGRLSLVAPLSNLLAAPLVAPAMGAAGVSLGAGSLSAIGLPELLLVPVQLLGALAIGGLIWIAHACAALPLASVELLPPFDLVGAGLAGLLVLVSLRRGRAATDEARPDGIAEPRLTGRSASTPARRPLQVGVALAAAVAVVLVSLAGARPDGRLHMTVLDVGQGDAILLVGPAGSRMLVDTGPDPDRLLTLLDARLPPWDRRLDLVVLTHPHEDHVAGLALLLDRYRIEAVAEPGMVGLGPGDAAYRERLAELGRGTRVLAGGDRLLFDGAEIAVRWPLRGRVPASPSNGGRAVNNVSIVLDIAFGERRLLLTGDVEEDVDAQLLAAGVGAPGAPPIDVLKVAHHGSGTATTDAFLERLQPRVAVISAGWGNPYGHPSPLTVGRLEAAGAQVLRTDVDGSVRVSTDGHDLRVDSAGGRPRPAPAALSAPAAVGPGFCPIPAPPAYGASAYNRPDGGSLAATGRRPASRPRPARVAAAPLRRRGRGRRLPGPCRRRAGNGCRSEPG